MLSSPGRVFAVRVLQSLLTVPSSVLTEPLANTGAASAEGTGCRVPGATSAEGAAATAAGGSIAAAADGDGGAAGAAGDASADVAAPPPDEPPAEPRVHDWAYVMQAS